MLKLKLQYFGHLMRRVDSLEKTLMLGGIGGRRRRDDRGWDGWMASLTWWKWVWGNSGSWLWTGRPGMLQLMGSERVGHDWATELNWTELNVVHILALMDSTDKGVIILSINTYFSANCDRTSGGKDSFSKTELSWKSTNSGHCFVLNYLVKWKYQ